MKTKLGAVNVLYPLPTTLVGAMVGGKPNFNTIAHVGVLTVGEPQCICLGMHKSHYTNQGIKDNRAFSVNLPSLDLVKQTDYCGLVSGSKVDKAALFKVFYGELEAAPMIEGCPVNMECRLYDVVDFPSHDVFIGQIVATYADEAVLTDGKPDVAKIKPLLFDMPRKRYWTLGPDIAGCWQVGMELKRQGRD